MAFWFTKTVRKGLAKKLRICLEEIQTVDPKKKIPELMEIIGSINETLNQVEFDKEDLPHILNGKLYRDETISNLIKLMPFFDQPVLNAISTFFQTNITMYISTCTNTCNTNTSQNTCTCKRKTNIHIQRSHKST